MTQPNQFTKAREEGRIPPAGTNHFKKGTRTRQDPRVKAQIRATQLMDRMHKFILGKPFRGHRIEMDNNQVTAARVLIDKGMPSLQAIEQTNINEWDQLSEDDIVSMAKALILAHPEVIQALNLIPNPAIVSQSADTELVPTITKVVEDTGT